jgi:hypothetical protein
MGCRFTGQQASRYRKSGVRRGNSISSHVKFVKRRRRKKGMGKGKKSERKKKRRWGFIYV